MTRLIDYTNQRLSFALGHAMFFLEGSAWLVLVARIVHKVLATTASIERLLIE